MYYFIELLYMLIIQINFSFLNVIQRIGDAILAFREGSSKIN